MVGPHSSWHRGGVTTGLSSYYSIATRTRITRTIVVGPEPTPAGIAEGPQQGCIVITKSPRRTRYRRRHAQNGAKQCRSAHHRFTFFIATFFFRFMITAVPLDLRYKTTAVNPSYLHHHDHLFSPFHPDFAPSFRFGQLRSALAATGWI